MLQGAENFDSLADGRFRLLRRLGEGGFGAVYEAEDAETSERVALKLLHARSPRALYRFKQEFRSLVELAHPNLVRLFELHGAGSVWFFTMELVDGGPFAASRPQFEETPTLATAAGVADSGLRVGAFSRQAFAPLANGFRQLVRGAQALHTAGKLHRDLKPSNVLLAQDGRVVLVDFGLVVEHDSSVTTDFVGTPMYMSPEQMLGGQLSPASDWYAVGVMLYEALTGRPPFVGPAAAVAHAKKHHQPPAPQELVKDVPQHLSQVCLELLLADVKQRADGDTLLGALDAAGFAASAPRATPALATEESSSELFGRDAESDRLLHAYQRLVSERRASVVLVRGGSGVGKSALVEHFLTHLAARPEHPLVLRGRCYEQESVPYKAFDSVLDALSRWLRRLAPLEAETLLPRHVEVLARLFPVLLQVEVIEAAARRAPAVIDEAELRRRGINALQELLARIADRMPLIVALDDLQWSDPDSGLLLRDLLSGDDAPALLLLVSDRGERQPAPAAVLDAVRRAGDALREEMVLEPLALGTAQALAASLLPEKAVEQAEGIARESGGLPYFVHQLARWAREHRRHVQAPSVDHVILQRAGALPEEAHRLLQILALAGRPLERAAALSAAAISTPREAVALLDSEDLIRVGWSGHNEVLEVSHDRIRESVAGELEPARANDLHRRLAEVLSEPPHTDPERVAHHLRQAGELSMAARWSERAARQASAALAFDRAARLYGQAIEAHGAEVSQELLEDYGEALSRAGRGKDACDVFLRAAQRADGERFVVLQRRAAEQALLGGHYNESIQLARKALAAEGIDSATGTASALWAMAKEGASMAVTSRLPLPRSKPGDAALARIDLCWTMVLGLMMIEPIHAGEFSVRHLRMASAIGDRYRLARAKISDAAFSAAFGRGSRAWGEAWGEAVELAREIDEPYLHGLVELFGALEAAGATDWTLAVERCDRATRIFREECSGANTEITWAHIAGHKALHTRLDFTELSRRLPAVLTSAADRGDQMSAFLQRLDVMPPMLLSRDQPGAAYEALEAARAEWPSSGFQVQHYAAMHSVAKIRVYQGRGAEAWETYRSTKTRMLTKLMMRIPFFSLDTAHLTACAAVYAGLEAKDSRTREARLADAERLAARVESMHLVSSEGVSHCVLGGVAHVRGRSGAALVHLERAARALRRNHTPALAHVADFCAGGIRGGNEGARQRREAEAGLHRFGVQNPAAMCRIIVPGVEL